MSKIADITIDEKYRLYESSVQNFESDLDFLEQEFKKVFKRKPETLREDFGGTGAMACAWTKRGKKNQSWAIDLDTEPINYGKKNHYKKLSAHQQKRIHYLQKNVLTSFDFKTDITCAFNFSYFIFKKRADLLKYFKQVRKGLNKEGLFFLDIFGGTDCRETMCEETVFDKHSYYWDCDRYNPLTSDVLYYIHFKDLKSNVKYEKVFTYDWRMWSVVEIKEILLEAGFRDVKTFWEKDGEDGDGSGEFYESVQEENCESWVTYIVGVK